MKPKAKLSFYLYPLKHKNIIFNLTDADSDESDNKIVDLQEENDNFFKRTQDAFTELFENAKKKNELHFVLSLNSTGFGISTSDHSTSNEAIKAFDDYVDYIKNMEITPLSVRITLALYCHLSEAKGFYQVPKNLLRILDGEVYNLWPFKHLIKKHEKTGELISPNTNIIMKDLIGHSKYIGLNDLALVFKDAFYIPLRNGFSHADYIITSNGIFLPPLNNKGQGEFISWRIFELLIVKSLNFFSIIRNIIEDSVNLYSNKKRIIGRLSQKGQESEWEIFFNTESRELKLTEH